jgi:16S rRNA (uracil1498-N3)-methyltransferase
MTAPLFLLDPDRAAGAGVGDEVALTGPEGRHAVAVTRLAPGEHLDLGDGAGTVLHAVVSAVTGRDSLRARVLERVDTAPPEPRLTVVQALPKADRGETAVATLTEVGVDRIVPWQAERSIARWTGDRAARGRARWVAAAQAAGKQARRPWFPEIGELAGGAEVAALVSHATVAVVLHEEAEAPLAGLAVPTEGEVVLVVGPEGGVTPAELERLAAAGAHLGRLGPTVLRTSTAGTVAAGIVLAGTARWS